MNGSMLEGLGEFTLHKLAPEPKISYQLHSGLGLAAGHQKLPTDIVHLFMLSNFICF